MKRKLADALARAIEQGQHHVTLTHHKLGSLPADVIFHNDGKTVTLGAAFKADTLIRLDQNLSPADRIEVAITATLFATPGLPGQMKLEIL